MSNNEITDISILKLVNYPKLKCLLLSNNYIKNIDVLTEAEFSILLELKLSNNKIDDISKLKTCKFKSIIKKLYLSHNNIKNIEPLICSKCFDNFDDISKRHRRTRLLNIHSCCFKDLNELKLAGNLSYTEKNNNKRRIEYLRSFIKVLII